MPETQKRAALYIRVSTDEQARHGYSLSEQEYDLKQYADRQGYRVIGIYADEGISARKALSRRKGLQRLLEDVEAEHVDIIIFKCLDRWFRNIADYYKVQEILDAHHVEWECSQESLYNTTTTNGRLMLNLKLSIAQHESDQTGDRVKYIHEGLKRIGRVITGHMPLGYRITEDKRIAIDEDAVPIVREAFDYFIVHKTVLGTFRMMREKYGYTKTEGSVGRMLQNRIYLGEYYGIKDFCPALIDEGVFAQAQKVFAGRTRHHSSGMIYLFGGLLHCPECGRLLTPRNRTLNRKIYTYYTCRDHTHGRGCPHKTYWREDHVEAALLASLGEELRKYLADIKKVTRKSDRAKSGVTVAELRTKQTRLKELYVEGLIDRSEFDVRHADLDAQIAALRPRPDVSIAYLETVAAGDFAERYQRLGKKARKIFWSRILDQVQLITGSPKPVFRAF